MSQVTSEVTLLMMTGLLTFPSYKIAHRSKELSGGISQNLNRNEPMAFSRPVFLGKGRSDFSVGTPA